MTNVVRRTNRGTLVYREPVAEHERRRQRGDPRSRKPGHPGGTPRPHREGTDALRPLRHGRRGVEVERGSLCGATQECVSLSPVQTPCRDASSPTEPPRSGGCEYECEGPNTRVKYCDGIEVERTSVCGATQECVSLSPTRTTCENRSSGNTPSTPSGCYYQCVGTRTRIHYCDGVEMSRQDICGPAQVCVNTSSTTVSCQNI